MFLTVLIFALISLTYWLLHNKHFYWRKRGVTQLKPKFFFGDFKDAILKRVSMHEIVQDAYDKFRAAGCQHGGIYLMYAPIWIPVDPDLVKRIMCHDFAHFTAHGFFFRHKNDILSNNLFNSEGGEWKHLRAKLTPAFSSAKLKLMFNLVDKLGERLENQIQKLYDQDQPIDLKNTSSSFLTDVIGSCAFGYDFNTLENPDNEFARYTKRIFAPRFISEILEQVVNWELLGMLGHTWMKKDVNDYFLKLIRDMVDYRDKNNISRSDLLDILRELRHKENVQDNHEMNTLSFNEVAANVFLTLAGFETTSTCVTFMMYELACNTNIQSKVREEIWKVCKNDPNHHITYEDLNEMKYCTMVIHETLRRHTIASELPRTCTKDYKIPGTDVVLQKGTFVLIPSAAIHNNPNYYSNPSIFNPENFNEANTSSRKDFAFFPFGEGPRLCIGARFAMIQIKLALVRYLRNYKYELNSSTSSKIEYEPNHVSIIPKGRVLLDISKVEEHDIYT